MVSINTSANAAVLASIRQNNNDLSATQIRIGTGKKINSASDNASVFSIAQSLRADASKQDGLTSGVTLAKGRADTAVAAINTVINLLGQVKTLAAGAASNTGLVTTDFTAVAAKITALNSQIQSTVNSATFKGENWLNSVSTSAAAVTIGYNGSAAATVGVVTQNLYSVDGNGDPDGSLSVYADTDAVSSNSTASDYSAAVTTAITGLTTYQSKLSSFSSSLGIQQDFLKSLSSIRDMTIGSLVDADLTEESAKSTAIQTQQQLAYQALSIGNSGTSSILRLFQ